MTSLSMEPMFDSLVVAIMAAVVVVAVLWLVTPPTTLPRQRWILFAFRCAAALVLLLAAFRPTLVRSDRRPADASLVIAVDASRSMTLSDGRGGDRWSLQRVAYRELLEGLSSLDESLAVEVLTYDTQARPVSSPTSNSLDEVTPDGDLTDLETAATASIELAAGKPLAGIVLMGDGTQTAIVRGGGPLRVAETLNSLGVPLWTIPIGPSGDASSARDVAVESLPESFSLFAGNQVDVPFSVATRGLAGLSIPVRLTWIAQDGTRTDAAERMVSPTRALDSTAMSIAITIPPPGTYRLVAQAETQSGELITSNNSQVAFADVRAGGGRVLYLEGQPRLEQSFLRRSLSQFPDLEITYQWIPSDTSSRWPVNLEPLFERGRFDVYILGDLDSTALGDRQLEMLNERVSEGAGLVTLGGFHAYERGGYANSPLADALPIKLDPSIPRADIAASESLESDSTAAGQLTGDILAQVAQPHPITRIAGEDNALDWSSLRPLLGANRFADIKVAPGIQVLLESPNEDPLLVIGEFGRGRTAAIAFDSTWRWWRGGQSEWHRRFWRQLVLWLLDRDTTTEDAIAIEIDSRRIPATGSATFLASLPLADDSKRLIQWKAEVVNESGETDEITTTSQSGGSQASGQLAGLAPGLYRLRVSDGSPASQVVPAEVGFQVIDQSRELEQPLADPVYLRQLADVTSFHGGRSFSPDEVGMLIDEIAKRRRRAEVAVVEKLRLGDGPISGWIVFTLFATAMTGEWLLRRKWSLP